MISLKLDGVDHLPSETAETLHKMVEVYEHVLETVAQKDKAYGGAWREQGWMGNTARILSKSTRLKNMSWKDEELKAREGLPETVMDLIAIATFWFINRVNGNKWGSQ